MTKTDNTEALEALDKIIQAKSCLRMDLESRDYHLASCIITEAVETIRAALTSQVPEGWQLVPKDLTINAYFPVMNLRSPTKSYVPTFLVLRHEDQAKRNHDQTVKRLAERGGLSWCELACVLQDKKYYQIEENEARNFVLSEWNKAMLAAAPVYGKDGG